MIQIQRPENGPLRLKTLGELQTQLDCDAYDVGKRKFRFKDYSSHEEVKKQLFELHHAKCCFCEAKVKDRIELDVEHFRPRAAYRQNCAQKKDERPGYYWLAYKWNNLILSCPACNRLEKRTFFPLKNPIDRATNHDKDVIREIPFLVDPVADDPRDHIRFINDAPYGKTPQGKVTIIRLGLLRHGLVGARRDHLNFIRKSYTALELLEAHSHIPEVAALAKEERNFIEDALRPEEQFSSMVIDYVGSHPL